VSYRDGPFNDLKVPLTWTAAVAVIVAGVVAAALLLSDRRETLQTQAYTTGKQVFDAADRPVSSVTAAPARWTGAFGGFLSDYLFAVSENRKLKKQLAEMQEWRDVAIAQENVNRRLMALLGMKTNPPIPMVSAKVVLDARGPYSNTRLANVGSETGIEVGNPVVSDRGLVGRIVGVTKGASRILLLSDIASRTPVLVDRTDARAILMGDGGPNPKLAYMRGQNPVRTGDRILTSGDGGVIPRGLPVGVAAKGLDGQWRVRLYADQSAIDFVKILKFQDFTRLVKTVELDRPQPPPPPTNESAQPAIVVAPPKPSAPPPAPAAAPDQRPPAQSAPVKSTPAHTAPAPAPQTTRPPAPANRSSAPAGTPPKSAARPVTSSAPAAKKPSGAAAPRSGTPASPRSSAPASSRPRRPAPSSSRPVAEAPY
jgi:rod shape-determining protein MreC